MSRPFVGVNVRLVEDSLREYGTIMFGIEMMREHIRISDVEPGQIDASTWWGLVPEVYRDEVWPVVERISLEFIRRRELLNEETMWEFRQTLNDAIWREVKPR